MKVIHALHTVLIVLYIRSSGPVVGSLTLYAQHFKEMLLSKALTCMHFFLYKQKMAILSWKRKHLAIFLYEKFIHLTQITLRPNIQRLSTPQHAYQSFLSYFLVLFCLQYCDTLVEL